MPGSSGYACRRGWKRNDEIPRVIPGRITSIRVSRDNLVLLDIINYGGSSEMASPEAIVRG